MPSTSVSWAQLFERVERGVEEPLQGGLAGCAGGALGQGNTRRRTRTSLTTHRAFGLVNMQLQPAQALKIKGLELVPALRGR